MTLRQTARVSFYLLMVGLGLCYFSIPKVQANSKTVHLIQISDDTINTVTADYITNSIDRAYEEGAECLILKLDTSGGLLASTRLIVKKILNAPIPVIGYIAPSGARAGSAGVFITYASHVAAMAPSTNIGAAHPVEMEPESPSPMQDKILNDTIAFIKAIARERNRNIEWGVKSVVQSDSITAQEALELNVIDMVTRTEQELLQQLDGRVVKINGEDRTLSTQNAVIQTIGMGQPQRFLYALAKPNLDIVHFLMILAFLLLLLQISYTTIGALGIIGEIFMIFAFYSMQTLPTNYVGYVLMGLGLLLPIVEVSFPGLGLLTLGGLALMVLAATFLSKLGGPVMMVFKSVIYGYFIISIVIELFLLCLIIRSHRKKASGGRQGLIGTVAQVYSDITPDKTGKVFVHGEIWSAQSDTDIQKGEQVQITAIDGLKLKVKQQHQQQGDA